MPHTSRRKKPQSNPRKRAEILDEDGWTRITTTDSSQRAPRASAAQVALDERYGRFDAPDLYSSSIAPAGMTADAVEKQYRVHEKRWLESDSYKALEMCLRQDVDPGVLDRIDVCLAFGTGSFCGSIQGWIERFHVALTQLGVFVSILDVIERITDRRPKAYAQEPTYNDLDVEFLSRFDITTIVTPEGFKIATRDSLVYLPGAELDVQLRSLAVNPSIALTARIDHFWRNERGEACTNAKSKFVGDVNKPEDRDDRTQWKHIHELTEEQRKENFVMQEDLDEIEVGLSVCEGFKEDKHEKRLPDLDARDMPFFDEYLYFRKSIDELPKAST